MRADLRPSRSLTARLTARLTAGLAAAAALAATTLAVTAGQASAADPLVGVGRAVTDDAQRGIFQVTAWTDAPQARITRVSAKVRQGDTVLVDIPTLPVVPDPWDPSVANLFRLPDTAVLKLVEDGGRIPALGTYAIDVTATDSLGNKVTRTDAGQLDFRLRPELTFDPGKPTYADRNARPSGTLVGIQPGSGDRVPLVGRPVSVERLAPVKTAAQQAVTDAAGRFTAAPYPVPSADLEAGTRFHAAFTDDSAEVHGTVEDYRDLSVWVPRKVAVTATADKKRALSGQTVTISGRMTDPAAANAPVADHPVRVRLGGPYGTGPNATVRTSADGRFTARLVAAAGRYSGGWTVESSDRYVDFPTRSGALAIPLESRTDLTSIRLSADGRVTVSGTFRARYETDPSFPAAQFVRLEQLVGGGWKAIAWASVNSAYYNDFTLSAASKGGWFRVRHLTTDDFAESVTPSFRLTRLDTRIVSLNAGPEPVAKGGYVTVTGGLQHYADFNWRAYANAPVVLQFQPRGSTAWKQMATGRSNASGNVSLKAKVTGDGTWRIRHYGDAKHFNTPASAGGDYVDMR
ncbi:hypothetical protein ASC82_24130 [Streptomyces sp. Root431]|uniref:hypothetical protein n=1 Tax=Streptomyces sp. Root431 TaxID=1736535 RepID=UPI0006F6B810|nr:hypothetical protein [Streptomyces sp. Root431]KQX10738.1 hypothetical protein ASC82_24130 [Streptomyces sp. Root431]